MSAREHASTLGFWARLERHWRRLSHTGSIIGVGSAQRVRAVRWGVAGNIVAACAPCNRMKGDMLPHEFFARYPIAGANFVRYARAVHRALKRNARRAVSLALAA